MWLLAAAAADVDVAAAAALAGGFAVGSSDDGGDHWPAALAVAIANCLRRAMWCEWHRHLDDGGHHRRHSLHSRSPPRWCWPSV